MEVLAPKAATEIEARLTEAEAKGELYKISLAALLHERGLNCRHMGLVRRQLSPRFRPLIGMPVTSLRHYLRNDCVNISPITQRWRWWQERSGRTLIASAGFYTESLLHHWRTPSCSCCWHVSMWCSQIALQLMSTIILSSLIIFQTISLRSHLPGSTRLNCDLSFARSFLFRHGQKRDPTENCGVRCHLDLERWLVRSHRTLKTDACTF